MNGRGGWPPRPVVWAGAPAPARVSWPWPRDDVRHLAALARSAARVQGRPIDQQLVVAWSYGRTLLTEINARDGYRRL